MITDDFASLLSKSSVIIYQNAVHIYKNNSSSSRHGSAMKNAPLKTGPKGPMTGGGPLNATKMANYRQRLREELEQENALKYLKKKKKK